MPNDNVTQGESLAFSSFQENVAPFQSQGYTLDQTLGAWDSIGFNNNFLDSEMRERITKTFNPQEPVAPSGIIDGIDYDNSTLPNDNAIGDRSYLDYSEQSIPMSILRATPTAVEGEEPTLAEIWDASTYRHWISSGVDRSVRQNTGGIDPSYEVKTEDLIAYNDAGYSEIEIGFLSEASSHDNFSYRIDRIKADREAKAIIEQGGGLGTGIEMLAGIADPLLVPTLFLGGVAASKAKWSSAKAVGLSMLSGGSQNLAVEYMLMQQDTQRSDSDLILAAAAGSLFSGTITAGVIGYRSARTRMTQANEIEAAHRDGVREAMDGEVYNQVDTVLKKEIPEADARKRKLTEKDIISELQATTGTRAETLSSKKIKAAKQKFRDYRKGQRVKIESMRSSKIRPSAKNKQIKQLEDSISRREDELTNLITENNLVLQNNAKLDQLQQGKIPESMQEQYLELKKTKGEFDSITSKQLGKGLPVKKEVSGEEASIEVPNDSVGAMRVRQEFSDIQTHDDLLTPTEIVEIENAVKVAEQLGINTPRISRLATKARAFRSASTQVDEAPDAATRGLGIQLLKNGTRTIEGHQSAEELAETLFFRNVPDYMASENAFDLYAKSKGLGFLGIGRASMREEFDKLVVLEQASGNLDNNVSDALDTPIMQAAKARSRIYERGLSNNKDYGVIGFDKIEHAHTYHSVVYSADNILSINAHADNIVDAIAKSYETGGIKLTRENAVRLAETQLERTFSYRSGNNGTFKKAMSEAEFKVLSTELKAKGIDSTTIAELQSSLFNKEDLAQMSPRAMFSLKPNLQATSGSVRMVDILDTSIDRVMKYASDSSANAGLASQGYKSRNQFLRAMEESRSAAINDLRIDTGSADPKVAQEAEDALAKITRGNVYQILDDAVKLMYREPVETGASLSFNTDITKLLRKQVAITRLRSTGLMSIPENAIAMARNGAFNTLAQLPVGRYFDLRSSSIQKDKFMNDFARTFTATGHQEYLFGAKFYNNSEFDDLTRTKMGTILNKLQGKAMNVTMTVNAFRTFQHGGEEMVARSIISNLKDLSVKGEITPNIRKSLIKVGGLSEDQVEEMITHFNERPDVDIFDSVRQMPPALHNAVSVAARNTIGSSFMRIGIGESVPYANREMGKVFTTLLNFSIASWEKMVVRGIKSDGLGLMAAMFAGQSALALMSQYAYVYSRASAMEDTERKKFIDKNLNDEGLFWGTFNRVGFLAAPTIPLQMLASARLLPEEIVSSPTKAGVSQAGGIPIVSMGQDLFNAAGSTGALITDKFDDKYMSNKDRERNWKKIKRVMPWIDSPVYNFTVGQID